MVAKGARIKAKKGHWDKILTYLFQKGGSMGFEFLYRPLARSQGMRHTYTALYFNGSV
jgi:hypothetical protein